MYLSSDYTRSNGEFGVPLHHPRFLEWVGTLESAILLKMGPGRWLHSLSREQAIDAARQLYRDMCLMTTILDILDQYGSPGLSFRSGGCWGHGTPGPPGCSTNGGHGAMAPFSGSSCSGLFVLHTLQVPLYVRHPSYHVCNSMPKCPPTIRPWPPYNLFMLNMDFIYILTDGYHFVCSTNKTINYAF